MDSTIRLMGTLCFGEVGRVLNTRKPTPVQELLKKRVILELDALTNADKTFLIEALMLWIHHYRLQEPQREVFKHAILIEEAHHVLLRKKASKETIMDVILREIRELGESIILIDQHPSLISLPSLGNTYCTIAMNLKHGRDVNAIADAMLLSKEDREILGRLEVGSGVVRLQGRWPKPFLVKFPLLPVKKGSVTDEELRRQFASDSGDSAEVLPLEEEREEIRDIRPPDKIRAREERITEEGMGLVRDVMAHPSSGVSERYKRMGLSVHRGYKVLRKLVSSSLLQSAVIATPWGRVKWIYPTKRGEELLQEMGYDPLPVKNESPEHQFWKYKLAELLREKGYEVTVEAKLVNGRIVDLLVHRDGTRTAIEIETGRSNSLENIRGLAALHFDKIVSVVLRKKEADSMIRDLTTNDIAPNGRVVVLTLSDFVKYLRTDHPISLP